MSAGENTRGPRASSPADESVPDVVALMREALGDAPPQRRMPPWMAWFVVTLLRYDERQHWALVHLLRDTDLALATAEPYPVVGYADWIVALSRSYLEVTCTASGERIARRADRWPPDATVLDPQSFTEWVTSLVVGSGTGAEVG